MSCTASVATSETELLRTDTLKGYTNRVPLALAKSTHNPYTEARCLPNSHPSHDFLKAYPWWISGPWVRRATAGGVLLAQMFPSRHRIGLLTSGNSTPPLSWHGSALSSSAISLLASSELTHIGLHNPNMRAYFRQQTFRTICFECSLMLVPFAHIENCSLFAAKQLSTIPRRTLPLTRQPLNGPTVVSWRTFRAVSKLFFNCDLRSRPALRQSPVLIPCLRASDFPNCLRGSIPARPLHFGCTAGGR